MGIGSFFIGKGFAMKIHPPFVIYRDQRFYSTFPGVAAAGGEIFVAFRRCPSYHGWPGVDEKYCCHYSPVSQLMLTRSRDGGRNWSEPELLYSPPEGASQDASLFFDGKYLFVSSFIWEHVPPHLVRMLDESGNGHYLSRFDVNKEAVALPGGVYVLRSDDSGKSFHGPYRPDPLPGTPELFPGHPRRMHNRGNITRGGDGSLLWVGDRFENEFTPQMSADVMLYRSVDDGVSWQFVTAAIDSHGDPGYLYEEPFLTVTPAGKYVLLVRSQRRRTDGSLTRADLVTAESTDNGRTWTPPLRHAIHAEPAAACRLPDGRTMIVYGYRKEPCGVRGRIVSPEFEDLDTAEEFVIRDDSPFPDTGYPGITLLDEHHAMAVYYIEDPAVPAARGIEGNIIEF